MGKKLNSLKSYHPNVRFFALTKKELVILAFVVVVACCGALAYFLLRGQEQASDTIKIGVIGDLGSSGGDRVWQEVVLAVEQVNAEGGVLGRNFEAVAEDDDSGSFDVSVATNALTRLIAVDEADFIISQGTLGSVYQGVAAQHEKILFDGPTLSDELTQKVLEDYDTYKYYFGTGGVNFTAFEKSVVDRSIVFREYTGLNKVALIGHGGRDVERGPQARASESLREEGFDVVYNVACSYDTIDFTSYFVAAEAPGAEIVYCIIFNPTSVAFVNEYATRQSPMILHGIFVTLDSKDAWELTGGNCEYVCVAMYPTVAGYPISSKTIPFREAYMARWNTSKVSLGCYYDVVRYILPDAIKRAGTIETDAVIKALEETSIETSLAKNFVFAAEHAVMVGEDPNDPDADYFIITYFQWQDGEMVPVYPKKLLKKAGATFKLPDWPGPWD